MGWYLGQILNISLALLEVEIPSPWWTLGNGCGGYCCGGDDGGCGHGGGVSIIGGILKHNMKLAY